MASLGGLIGAGNAPTGSATVTITIASPAVVSWTAHGLLVGAPVTFTTTGALPTGLVASTTYYVSTVVAVDSFQVSATLGGSAVNTTGTQSGTHTGHSAGTDNLIYVWGLYHLVGTTVSVFVDVWDCGDFTVAADGSVALPVFGTTYNTVAGEIILATLIADDAATYGEQATPLTVHSAGTTYAITVPVVIGAPFVAQGQRVRSILPADTGTEREETLGIARRTHFFAMLVTDGVNVRVGTSLTPTPLGDMILCQFADPGERLPLGTGYDGVWRETFDDPGAENYDSMLCWQTDRPYPFCLMSVSQFIVAQEQ